MTREEWSAQRRVDPPDDIAVGCCACCREAIYRFEPSEDGLCPPCAARESREPWGGR